MSDESACDPSPAAASPGTIRAIAVGVIVWRDHLLGQRRYDHINEQTFYRPLGGGIEFGERARETVIRELREELGREVEVGALISVAENLFSFDGTPEHQIVFEFAASFAVGQEPPDLEPMSAHEDDGSPFEARWLPLVEVLDGTHIVYPEGFRGRLAAWLNR